MARFLIQSDSNSVHENFLRKENEENYEKRAGEQRV